MQAAEGAGAQQQGGAQTPVQESTAAEEDEAAPVAAPSRGAAHGSRAAAVPRVLDSDDLDAAPLRLDAALLAPHDVLEPEGAAGQDLFAEDVDVEGEEVEDSQPASAGPGTGTVQAHAAPCCSGGRQQGDSCAAGAAGQEQSGAVAAEQEPVAEGVAAGQPRWPGRRRPEHARLGLWADDPCAAPPALLGRAQWTVLCMLCLASGA